MLKEIHWLGNSGFRWDGPKTIYFDPYKPAVKDKIADIILVSHEHFDHFSRNDIMAISSPRTCLFGSFEVVKNLKSAASSLKEVKAMSAGDTVTVLDIAIRAVTGYNIGKPFHPKDSGKLGYIVTMGGVSVYHAGDTDLIPEMNGYRCDVALLPVGGTYVMNAEEAAEAALIIKPKFAVPMHYGSPKQAQKFRDLLKGKIEVVILKKES
ncbi:MAG: MBL fold metallo-hydrolase [Candidatus Omnitrophota bacterium]